MSGRHDRFLAPTLRRMAVAIPSRARRADQGTGSREGRPAMKFSPRQLAALRFLGAGAWAEHPWWSISAAIRLQSPDGKRLNGYVAAKSLVGKGLAEAEYGSFRITESGLCVLAELEERE